MGIPQGLTFAGMGRLGPHAQCSGGCAQHRGGEIVLPEQVAVREAATAFESGGLKDERTAKLLKTVAHRLLDGAGRWAAAL